MLRFYGGFPKDEGKSDCLMSTLGAITRIASGHVSIYVLHYPNPENLGHIDRLGITQMSAQEAIMV